MGNKTIKAVLCLLIIAVVFAGIGCAGRNADKNSPGSNDPGSTGAATPTPAPAATGHPTLAPTGAPTLQPESAVDYTTNLSPDDVIVSDGDEQDEFPEDTLPTPSAE